MLARQLSKAVVAWCSSADREPVAASDEANAATVGWLCGQHRLRYFRSVYVTGPKGPHALVCEDNGTSSLKYFGIDLVAEVIADGACVPAEFDGSVYQLVFDNVNRAETTE